MFYSFSVIRSLERIIMIPRKESLHMKYKQWLDTWLTNYVKPIAKRKTFENYSYLINKHIKRGIGELELKKISIHEIQRFIVYLLNEGNIITKKGLSSSTVNSIVTIIQSSLKKAYLIGIIKKYNGQEIQRSNYCFLYFVLYC